MAQINTRNPLLARNDLRNKVDNNKMLTYDRKTVFGNYFNKKTTNSVVDPKPSADNLIMDVSKVSKIPVMKSRIPQLQTAKFGKENQFVPDSKVSIMMRELAISSKNEKKLQDVTKSTNCQLNKLQTQPPPQAVKQQEKVENIDTETSCFLLSDYAPEIYQYLRQLENKQSLVANFLAKNNSTMTGSMRSILVNWLITVHQSFHLGAETLYICISIMDRYFAHVPEPVPKNRIQLVGITALLVASKFEEIYYPELSQFVNVCDNLYTKRDLIRMELRILDVLRFELGRPIPLHFLRRGSKAAHVDGRTHMLAKYLCELTLTDYELAHWKPSLLAATALYLSLRLIAIANNDDDLHTTSATNDRFWNATLEHYTGYSIAEILKHVPLLARVIVNSETSKHQNCRKKYSSAKYMEISKMPQLSHKLVKRFSALVNTNATTTSS